MKKITVLNEYPIYPPFHGGKMRIFNQYKHLSKYFCINYLCFEEEGTSVVRNKINDNFTEIKIPKSFIHRCLDKTSPYIMLYFYEKFVSLNDIVAIYFSKMNGVFKKTVEESAKESDILISTHNYLYSHIKGFRNKLRIYESLNVETALKEEYLNYPLTKPLINIVKKSEQEACNDCNLIFATSQEDSVKMGEYFGNNEKIFIIPNGVDTRELTPCSLEEKNILKDKYGVKDKNVVLFIGSGHPPNVEAGKWIQNILSYQVPSAVFFIVGSVCWLLSESEAPENVKLLYQVEEKTKQEMYKIADIAINPVSIGSGTNIKMLDYFAAGLPVVSTSVGARGLECENGKEFIISNLEDFPKNVTTLLENKDIALHISKNARILVEKKFDCDIIAAYISDLLNEKLKNGLSLQ